MDFLGGKYILNRQANRAVRDLQGSALAAVQPILDRQRSSGIMVPLLNDCRHLDYS